MTAAGNQIVDFMNRNARTEAQFIRANTHKPMASGPNGSVLRPKIFEILGISRAAHIERTAHPAQKTTGILSKWERSKESPESMLMNSRVQGSKHNSATKKANATGRFNNPSMTSLFCWGRSPVERVYGCAPRVHSRVVWCYKDRTRAGKERIRNR